MSAPGGNVPGRAGARDSAPPADRPQGDRARQRSSAARQHPPSAPPLGPAEGCRYPDASTPVCSWLASCLQGMPPWPLPTSAPFQLDLDEHELASARVDDVVLDPLAPEIGLAGGQVHRAR